MKITKVGYSALLNLGNYQNEKITFIAQLNDGETPESAVEALRDKVKAVGGKNAEDLYKAMHQNERKLRDLNQQIEQATQKWNATAEFLRAQGLKPEAPDMPQFTNLLPEFKVEDSGVIDGEIEDEDLEDKEDDNTF